MRKAQYGRSKGDCRDCNLLNLGLVLDGSGFVRRSQVMADNVVKHQTMQEILRHLQSPKGALVVMDRGIATAQNLQWLRDNDYRYVVVSRERKCADFDLAQALRIRTAADQNVYFRKELAASGVEVRLYCYSPVRTEKERGRSERFSKKFEQVFKQLSDVLSRKGLVKGLGMTQQRIDRVQERIPGVSQIYQGTWYRTSAATESRQSTGV